MIQRLWLAHMASFMTIVAASHAVDSADSASRGAADGGASGAG